MKQIKLELAKSILVIVVQISWLWALVEFILYLVKDKPFNWISVWTFVVSVVLAIVIAWHQIRLEHKEDQRLREDLEKWKESKSKNSSFQQRIDERLKQRN